ncbi:MAG: hypothetical protein M1819_006653 [Sarea resinae]|nr:MAG: hypothetical protein M1819_006653 [Sarea resinae]
MDFWARLIGGVGSASSKQSVANNPQQRLARFKRVYNQLLQTWRGAPSHSADPAITDGLRLCLQRLTSLLQEESRAPAPHLCTSFAASSQIYVTVSKVASTSLNDGVVREALSAFSTLIDSEEEEFLGNDGFARALMALFGKIAGTSAMIVSADTEGEVVELLFGIAAKIRLQPEILPVWFTLQSHGARRVVSNGDGPKFAGVTNKEDFPLFYLLIDYVHHEGRVGDFARTGLLYIIESASNSKDLERWIVKSDLATLMASGLGALYSQLSRKLVISYPEEETPVVLALSDHQDVEKALHAESSASPDFQAHMQTFLSYLMFWQDVLEHCRSYDVKETLLDHFQILFLQQLLYPSLLESSDVDGGSVAVLTYLRHILDSLDHPDLIHLVLHYLLALPDQSFPESPSTTRSPLAERRRKSLDLLARYASLEDKTTPAIFNLVDLILTSMRSKSQQTVTATLKLVSVILRRHHLYAVPTLLRTAHVGPSAPQRTVGAYNKELEALFGLVQDVGTLDGIDESYENYLKDTLKILETHPCSMQLLAIKGHGGSAKKPGGDSILEAGPREAYQHSLSLEDPLLKCLLDTLSTFFTNTVETNFALTEAIVALACCGYMHLEGWLLVDPSKYEYDEDLEESKMERSQHADGSGSLDSFLDPIEEYEKQQICAMQSARREPSWSKEHTPPVFASLQSLVQQLDCFRDEVPAFDRYLAERKEAFQVSDKLNDALASAPLSSQEASPDDTIQMPTPQRMPAIESISQRIFSDGMSRSSSPRGRAQGSKILPIPSPSGRAMRHTRLSSPTSSQESRNRRAFSRSPLRDNLSSTTHTPPHGLPSFGSDNTDFLKRKIAVRPAKTSEVSPAKVHPQTPKEPANGDASNIDGRDDTQEPDVSQLESDVDTEQQQRKHDAADEGKEEDDAEMASTSVSLNHLLTNVIILQEFILELAALVQVRASLFGEVKFL